jgi:hypothetical protein
MYTKFQNLGVKGFPRYQIYTPIPLKIRKIKLHTNLRELRGSRRRRKPTLVGQT